MQNFQETIQSLRKEILEHIRLYDENRPVISDAQYDELFNELVALEAANPELITPDSPTQRIVTEFVKSLETRRHRTPLQSLDKVKTAEDILKFARSIPKGPIVVEDKFDGLTIGLNYDDGHLLEAVSRGNGEEGEVITHTVRTIRNVPKHIPFKGRLEIRGEAVIPFAEFERINAERLANGEELYSHPRNLASGTLRQLDASVAANRGVQLFAYDITYIDQAFVAATDQWMMGDDVGHLAFLKAQGFTVAEAAFFMGEKEYLLLANERLEQYAERRRTLPYAVDGLVIKATSLAVRDELGSTGHHPKWAIAYKFPAQIQHTILRAVEKGIGKTGIIAPVAVFDEVDLDGARTTRATLHNWGMVAALGLRIGDTIAVARANDVIPQVIGVVEGTERGTELVVPPTECPHCHGEVIYEGAYLKCVNPLCVPVLIERLVHFASRDALDIEGLGDSMAARLVQDGFVHDVSDVFALGEYFDALTEYDGLGKRSVEKLLAAIETAKTRPVHRVLYSLAIPLVGRSLSKALVEHFGSMEAIMNASYDELAALDDIGAITAETIVEWFGVEENRALVARLQAHGVNMVAEKKQLAGDALAGKTVVITGTLSKPRSHFEELVAAHGGKCSSSVGKKTDYVLAGAEAGGKLDKAQVLQSQGAPVQILDEERFLSLIGV